MLVVLDQNTVEYTEHHFEFVVPCTESKILILPNTTHMFCIVWGGNFMRCVSTNQDEFSLLVEKWNTQRTQALGHSLLRVLYPLMEQELRTKLLQEAKEFVTQVCVCVCVW